jgi:hypothetical protein
MPQVGFKSMIPAFERAKPVHAIDLAVSMIGWIMTMAVKSRANNSGRVI